MYAKLDCVLTRGVVSAKEVVIFYSLRHFVWLCFKLLITKRRYNITVSRDRLYVVVISVFHVGIMKISVKRRRTDSSHASPSVLAADADVYCYVNARPVLSHLVQSCPVI